MRLARAIFSVSAAAILLAGGYAFVQPVAAVAGLDDSCLSAGSGSVNTITQTACTEVSARPSPEQLLCIDVPDCSLGCCAVRGQLNKWRKCVAGCSGVTCPGTDCANACFERYCS